MDRRDLFSSTSRQIREVKIANSVEARCPGVAFSQCDALAWGRAGFLREVPAGDAMDMRRLWETGAGCRPGARSHWEPDCWKGRKPTVEPVGDRNMTSSLPVLPNENALFEA